MTRSDVQIVEFPSTDDWYGEPKMLVPSREPDTSSGSRATHKHDLSVRPLESAGKRSGRCDLHAEQVFPASAGGHRELQGHRGSVPVSGLDISVMRSPSRLYVFSTLWPNSTPSWSSRSLRARSRWGVVQRAPACRRGDPRQGDVLPRRRDTYRNIPEVDFVPSLSPQNLAALRGRQGLHAEPRLHHERLRRTPVGRAAIPRQAAKEVIEEQWKKTTRQSCPSRLR